MSKMILMNVRRMMSVVMVAMIMDLMEVMMDVMGLLSFWGCMALKPAGGDSSWVDFIYC